MQKLKILMITTGLLLTGILIYFFSPYSKNEHVSISTQTASINEQLENLDPEEKKKIKKELNEIESDEEKADKPSSITEEIKENVREVLKGVVRLFIQDMKVVSIGDSLTQGVGDETGNGGYVGILNNTFEDNEINITIDNFGKRGNRTDQLLKRLEEKEIADSIKNADVVLITIGANDIMKIVKSNFIDLKMETFEEEKRGYKERLKEIFDKVNEYNPDAEIYLIGFYNPFEGYFGNISELEMVMKSWNTAGKSVTEEFENVNYIPTADLFEDSDLELLAEDYFHPNTNGYKLIAKRVLEHVKEIDLEAEVEPDDSEPDSEVIE
ncbi:SGNH/GDSL hydrolase family protein [Rossellomorea vietnamensis]|uniref:SGNH/GDSL hydrolase family protein n=2 Tax=Rossellomorea TaxID=2837508 RepID=A0A5D4KJI9_9BACI|nr:MULTISPECIES: SGNH/GDSL hydrolase family protein [Rossellomorea]TYR77412.1 SGNH/GDSL hydrolase family protein [Rossellomorea vietnamensis]TYS82359.1 SGNH/GDSL hydrolase family protein [Rossellomorea aquimaris]